MKLVSSERPLGEIQSNSIGNCIRGRSPAAISANVIRAGPRTQFGPHSWNGPRAHELELRPASAMIPGNCGSWPKASNCQAVAGAPPRTSRWYPIP